MSSKKWSIPPRFRKLLVMPPIMIGALVVLLLVMTRSGLPRKPLEETSRVLRVIQVPQTDVIPRVLGFGAARPERTWRAIAEVKGRVIDVHPELRSGALVKEGTKLLEIDPAEYQIAVDRLTAEVEQTKTQIEELDAQADNYRASLKIEKESLALAKRDLQRLLRLRGNASQAEVEALQRAALAQQQSVQNLQNALNLVPVQRNSLNAALDVKKAALQDARLNLQNTVISAPFDCRLSEVTIDKGQFLAAGQTLFEAHGTAVTEVEAQVPADKMVHLLNLTPSDISHVVAIIASMDTEKIRGLLQDKVTAIVRMHSGDLTATWKARLSTVRERIDPQTRTLGVVVAVDRPYEKFIPGKRPPLVKGMFCEVELRGTVRKNQIVVPRLALQGEYCYLVNKDSRLERRQVQIDFAQSGIAVVKSGLRAGETLVVSDPTPAIEGMSVEAVDDPKALADLLQDASGEEALR